METNVIKEIIGLVPINVTQDSDTLVMRFSNGAKAKWHHYQDCCEDVVIDDVVGDWADILGHPLLVAEERISENNDLNFAHETWTFYTFRNIGGSVDVRWCGSSNGYYSESVDFDFTQPSEPHA